MASEDDRDAGYGNWPSQRANSDAMSCLVSKLPSSLVSWTFPAEALSGEFADALPAEFDRRSSTLACGRDVRERSRRLFVGGGTYAGGRGLSPRAQADGLLRLRGTLGDVDRASLPNIWHAECSANCSVRSTAMEDPLTRKDLISRLFPCARVDSNHHGPSGPQGPQPCASTNSATGAEHASIDAAPRPRPFSSHPPARTCIRPRPPVEYEHMFVSGIHQRNRGAA